MIQLGLFDPAPLPLGLRVKPTVADLIAGAWEPAPWPEGYACIYKATLVGTTRAYVGKTVDLRERFRRRMCEDEYICRALNAHGPENFFIEVLRVFETEDDAYAQEDSFIEAHRTRKAHGGYNIGDGGKGFTSEEKRRWHATPEGQVESARSLALGNETIARRAGYPLKRVLAALEKGPRTRASLVASLGLTGVQVQHAFGTLRDKGHHIIREHGRLFRLCTFEEAADDWASGRALRNMDRVLGALMEGPGTMDELMAALAMSRKLVWGGIECLRKNGYNVECRGVNANRSVGGTYHLIIDHKRHPWLHLGTMDLRGAAWDDRCNSVANSAWSCYA